MFGRTELIKSESATKNCRESDGDFHVDVAPREPCKKLNIEANMLLSSDKEQAAKRLRKEGPEDEVAAELPELLPPV